MPAANTKWEFERDRSVLIVIDMQNYFVREGAVLEVKDSRAQIPTIKKLIEKCREYSVPIIYTVHEPDAVFSPLEVDYHPGLQNFLKNMGPDDMKVISELAPMPNDIVLRKRRFSAFYQTDLELILRNIRGKANPVDTIIICGTVTNICCESTARDAFFRDYKVVFGTDVCSALTPESHNATLVNMEIFGRSLDCDAIVQAIEAGRG